MKNEFVKFAKGQGISGLNVHRFSSHINNKYHNSPTLGGYINPTIIEERQLQVAQIDVFSRLMMERIVFLGTDIDDDVSNIITAQLLFLESTGNEDISLYINSNGGLVYSGLAIYDTMNMINCNIGTNVTGIAASMAYVLAIAGTKGKRSALPHSRLMQHQPMGGAMGQASDLEITTREINKLKTELIEIIAEHTGQSSTQVRVDCDRDYWLTAQEAVDYGAIDTVIRNTKKNIHV